MAWKCSLAGTWNCLRHLKRSDMLAATFKQLALTKALETTESTGLDRKTHFWILPQRHSPWAGGHTWKRNQAWLGAYCGRQLRAGKRRCAEGQLGHSQSYQVPRDHLCNHGHSKVFSDMMRTFANFKAERKAHHDEEVCFSGILFKGNHQSNSCFSILHCWQDGGHGPLVRLLPRMIDPDSRNKRWWALGCDTAPGALNESRAQHWDPWVGSVPVWNWLTQSEDCGFGPRAGFMLESPADLQRRGWPWQSMAFTTDRSK